VLTSDRGLCGGFNSNINRAAEKEARTRTAAGAKRWCSTSSAARAATTCAGARVKIRRELIGVFDGLTYAKAAEIGRDIVREYTGGGSTPCT